MKSLATDHVKQLNSFLATQEYVAKFLRGVQLELNTSMSHLKTFINRCTAQEWAVEHG